MSLPAQPSTGGTLAPLDETDLESRVASSLRLLVEVDACRGSDEKRARLRAAMCLNQEGARLLDLATCDADQPVLRQYTLLAHMLDACDDELVQVAVTSVTRFGFQFPPLVLSRPTVLHGLAGCTRDQAKMKISGLTQLAELLLEQPSCTREIVSARNKAGDSCLSALLTRLRPERLPLALVLQRRHRPLSWEEYWVKVPRDMVELSGSVETLLRFLLADPAWIEVDTQDRGAQTTALTTWQTNHERHPHNSPIRLMYEILRKLESTSREREVGTSSDAAACVVALRLWLERQLADIPTQCLSADLHEQLSSSESGIAALIQALNQQPEAVRLDERNSAEFQLLDAVLAMDPSRLPALEPVAEALFARVAAMAAGPVLSINRREHITKLAAAAAEAPGGFLDRLLVALIDGPLVGPLAASSCRSLAGRWFHDLGSYNCWRPLPSRGVRRIIDLLAVRGLTTTVDGRTFEEHLDQHGDHLRDWLAVLEGTDWCASAELISSAMERTVAQPHFGFISFSNELTAQLLQWNRVHWPKIRADLELHLIPDLAAIALSYLQAPQRQRQQPQPRRNPPDANATSTDWFDCSDPNA